MKVFINGGVRGMLLLLAGVLLVSMVSCGGGGGAVREVDGHGNPKPKPSSAVPTVAVVYNDGYQVTVQGKNVHSVVLEFAGGTNEVYMLSRQGTCFSTSRETLEAIRVMSKSGDYWYFDGMGVPLTETEEEAREASGLLSGTLALVKRIIKVTPAIKVKTTGGPYGTGKTTSTLSTVVVNVTSDVAYTEVKVATTTDEVLVYDTSSTTTSGSYDTEDTVEVEAVLVVLAADGSKWYFDAYGNVLPLDSKWYTDLD